MREVQPGLNYHLPIRSRPALTPPALRVIKTDVGMRQSGAGERDVPEESLMLTGDENIVDVHFWCCGRSNRTPSATIYSISRIPKAP